MPLTMDITTAYTATIPANTATGQYRVTMGLWDSAWTTLTWLNDAYDITVN